MKCNAAGLILFRKEHPARPVRSLFRQRELASHAKLLTASNASRAAL